MINFIGRANVIKSTAGFLFVFFLTLGVILHDAVDRGELVVYKIVKTLKTYNYK